MPNRHENSFFRNEKITHTLFSIANAVNTANDLDGLYRSIYQSLNQVIHLPNFFIAIVDKNRKRLSFPFFIDEQDTRETIAAGLERYETSTSNTSQVIFKKTPLFLKKETLQKRLEEKKTIGSASVVWIGVPLIVRDEVIGVMVIQHYSDPDYFTQDDVDLLIAVSDQVALAIDRKKAQERIKSSERLTRTLFSIANAVNTANNLDELYQSIYEALNRLIALPNFFICLLSRDGKKMDFPFYLDEYDSKETISFSTAYSDTGNYISTDVIRTRKPLLLDEQMLRKRVIRGRLLGSIPKVWLGVPLIIRDTVTGVMAVQHYHDPDYFSQKDIDLFIAVSGQVAIAIDRQQTHEDLKKEKEKAEQANVELQNEINERKHSENINRTLYAISNAVNITRDLDELYQKIHQLLGEVIDVTNFFIAIVDNRTNTLYFPYHVDTMDDDFSPIIDFNPDQSLSGMVVTRREGILLGTQALEKISRSQGALGPLALTWMGVPLLVRDEVIGLIAVQSYTDPDLYTEKDLRVMSSVSDQVAIAIDRKRAEDRLRMSEKRYRHLFRHAPAAMYEIDFIRSGFVSVNREMCILSGYTEQELLSKRPVSFFTRESKKRFLEQQADLLKGIQPVEDIEYDVFRKDGQIRRVVFHYDFFIKDAAVQGALVVVHDITERKKMEEMMIQSEKMMSVGGLAAGMAHEINNPLAGIMQNVQVILNRLSHTLPVNEEEARKSGTTIAAIETYMERRKIRQMLENIHKAGSNAAAIVNNMLSFARKGAAVKSNRRLPELADKAIELARNDYDLKKSYDFRQIEIIREFDPTVPDIACEESKILQVIFNIIKNAAEAMYSVEKKTAPPRIRLRVFQTGDMVQMEIEDNGPGIDETVRKRIFEPFFTTKAVDKGTGLGLSLSYFIVVDDHGGEMSVESTVGAGTTFIIRLPAA